MHEPRVQARQRRARARRTASGTAPKPFRQGVFAEPAGGALFDGAHRVRLVALKAAAVVGPEQARPPPGRCVCFRPRSRDFARCRRPSSLSLLVMMAHAVCAVLLAKAPVATFVERLASNCTRHRRRAVSLGVADRRQAPTTRSWPRYRTPFGDAAAPLLAAAGGLLGSIQRQVAAGREYRRIRHPGDRPSPWFSFGINRAWTPQKQPAPPPLSPASFPQAAARCGR
jgi:hypothetical protein